ncbi:MAG TPA: TonB-dependent receptor, partial [Bacteroidetes bacterium]|nr:TonB-dependent receptor [Bacteroidota bacterium]
MKNFLILCLSFFLVINIMEAQPGKGRKWKSQQQTLKGYISGNVIDSLSGEPVEFAVVEILSGRSGKQVNGAMSDENGHFKIDDVKTGKYKVKVSFIGYTPKIVDGVELTLEKPDKNIGNVLIAQSVNMLSEVQIVDQRSLVESKIDKVVYNVSKDPTLVGGDATDVLRKVPMLSVDMDGNVSLRGSTKVKILLNGKPSGLFADDVGEALQMFPADEIKKVEVLTSPGAKYDGEGSAGIINIITKKGIINGVKGSVRSFVGDRMEHLNGSLAIGKGRFGMNARLGARYKLPTTSTNVFHRESYVNGNTLIYDQNGESNVSRLGVGGVLGGFYDFNAYNSINTSLRIRGHGYDTDGSLNVLNGVDSYERFTKSTRQRSTYNWTTDYTKKFKSNKEKKLVLATQVEGNIQNNTNEKYYDYDPTIENNDNKGLNREITFQIDYTHPVSQNIKIETGAKSILRNLTSDFSRTYTLKPTNIDSIDYQNTDIFYYDQNVYAGYLSGTFNLANRWVMIAGVRYEHTQIKGDFDKFEA